MHFPNRSVFAQMFFLSGLQKEEPKMSSVVVFFFRLLMNRVVVGGLE